MIYPELEAANKNGAIHTRSFWDDDASDSDFECFCKPIRTPLMNRFFGMDGYNCHPLQKYDK